MNFKTLVVVTIAAMLLDYVFFKLTGKIYGNGIGFLDEFKNYMVVPIYFLLVVGILVFVPLTTIKSSIGYGALFGFVIYGIYNLTNYAITNQYATKIVILDTAWGTLLCSILSFITFYLNA